MRLVVCVDRDDDLGRKAGVSGPVVGRAQAVDAATRLAIADPEDSDTNAIFAAVSLVDELRGAGEDCEVCVLTGSPKVGVLSDRRVADQFDQVLERVRATSAYLRERRGRGRVPVPDPCVAGPHRRRPTGLRTAERLDRVDVLHARAGPQGPQAAGEDGPPVRPRAADARDRRRRGGPPLGSDRARDPPRDLPHLLDVRHRRGDHRLAPLRLHRYPAGLRRFRVRAVLGRARGRRVSRGVQLLCRAPRERPPDPDRLLHRGRTDLVDDRRPRVGVGPGRSAHVRAGPVPARICRGRGLDPRDRRAQLRDPQPRSVSRERAPELLPAAPRLPPGNRARSDPRRRRPPAGPGSRSPGGLRRTRSGDRRPVRRRERAAGSRRWAQPFRRGWCRATRRRSASGTSRPALSFRVARTASRPGAISAARTARVAMSSQ